MGLAGLAAFVWALRHGQFDDPEGDASRVLIPRPPGREGVPAGPGTDADGPRSEA
ncbi:MAG: cbb3-type cytochrome oxidase assembly protein CcoS [Paracoccaceae bacterium]|nr:cbb3-type cytochrome oxidase assembly protein CcoS [Paracoccaceae bacterium]